MQAALSTTGAPTQYTVGTLRDDAARAVGLTLATRAAGGPRRRRASARRHGDDRGREHGRRHADRHARARPMTRRRGSGRCCCRRRRWTPTGAGPPLHARRCRVPRRRSAASRVRHRAEPRRSTAHPPRCGSSTPRSRSAASGATRSTRTFAGPCSRARSAAAATARRRPVARAAAAACLVHDRARPAAGRGRQAAGRPDRLDPADRARRQARAHARLPGGHLDLPRGDRGPARVETALTRRASYVIAPGKQRTVRLSLSTDGRSALKRYRTLKTRVTITTSAGVTATRRVTLAQRRGS